MKQNKADLISNINRDLADNATQEITPRDVRQNLLDIIDSTANFFATEEIVSSNFSTPAVRSTIAGDYVLEKLGQESYTSEDNSAFGYAALRQNFQGSKNTAIGCFSLNCNVYGTDNVAVGYEAIAGNSNGVGNVGIGNYSLYYNKLGNMNVAIGHGAGYYADRESSQKLYIGVHPVTEQYVCDNPEGEGLTPLVYGDFELQRFGVNVNSFHPYGTVQVSGGISPSEDNEFELGHIDYAFSDVNTRSVSFWEGNSYTYDPESDTVVVSGVQSHADDIKPLVDNTFSLGSPSNNWRNINTYNLSVLGTATVNEYKAVTTCLYECKTLYLATSGVCDGEVNPCGYLSDEEIDGAGLVIPSSGVDGLANYNWTLQTTGRDLRSLPNSTNTASSFDRTAEQNACFGTTTNVELSGVQTHIIAPQHLGRGNTLFGSLTEAGTQSNYLKGMCATTGKYDPVVFSNFDLIDQDNSFGRDAVNSITPKSRFKFNITGLRNSSVDEEMSSRRVSVQTVDSEVPASVQFQHGATYALGTEFYSTASGSAPGLYIHTYNNSSSSDDINTVSIMQDDATGGVLGVTDFEGMGKDKLPETIINARSKADASIRVTAENAGDVTAALELCGNKNCLEDAAEFAYHRGSGIATISTYLDSGRLVHTTYDAANDKVVFNHGRVFVGEGNDSGSINIVNHAEDTILQGFAGHTRLYSREVDMPDQSSELIYVDSDGNSWPLSLVTSQLDPVFWDSNVNLWGGSGTPYDVNNDNWADGAISNNTVYGNFALRDGTSGDDAICINNTAIGMGAGSGIRIATDNIIIGQNCAGSGDNINNNVLIGNDIGVDNQNFNNVILGNNIINKSSNSILIGNEVLNGVTASGMSDQTFMLGNQDHVLMSGSMPAHHLYMPNGGKFSVQNSDNTTSATITSNRMEVIGSGDRYGVDPFEFYFTGSDTGLTSPVMTLDHSAYYGMNNTQQYETTNPRRPFVHFNGDARVRGAIRFADGTSLESAATVQNFEEQLAAMQELIDTQTIEGIMLENVASPDSPSSPTIGVMSQLNGESATIVLRDQYLRLEEGDYVIANRIKNDLEQYEYRPVWVSNESSTCGCGRMVVEEEEEDPLDGGNP